MTEQQEAIRIQREIRLSVATGANYWTPVHFVLVGGSGIPPGDAVTTCICWLFGKRPTSVPIKAVESTRSISPRSMDG